MQVSSTFKLFAPTAEEALEMIRSYSHPQRVLMLKNDLLSELRKRGMSLKRLGTSRKALERLCRNNHRLAAISYLEKVRNEKGLIVIKEWVFCIDAHLREARIQPEDIGSSKKELDTYFRKSCLFSAVEYVVKGSKVIPEQRARIARQIRHLLYLAGYTPDAVSPGCEALLISWES